MYHRDLSNLFLYYFDFIVIQLYSRSVMSLFLYYYNFILVLLQPYSYIIKTMCSEWLCSCIILTLFLKRGFILMLLQLYFHVMILFPYYYNFILELFQIYSRNMTLF